MVLFDISNQAFTALHNCHQNNDYAGGDASQE